jgi:hypothetical protein
MARGHPGCTGSLRQESQSGPSSVPFGLPPRDLLLAGLRGPRLGKSTYRVKNSEDILTLSTLRVNTNDILVSFDVTSLFTKVPKKDVLDFLSRLFDEDVRPFHHVLTSSLLCFSGHFYDKINGTAMRSPLSPMIFIYFMEDSE